MSEILPDDSAGDALPQSDRLQILSPEEYELIWVSLPETSYRLIRLTFPGLRR